MRSEAARQEAHDPRFVLHEQNAHVAEYRFAAP
jgi:hypothetical protein